MAVFSFTGVRQGSPQKIRGEFEARCSARATTLLREQGITVIDINELEMLLGPPPGMENIANPRFDDPFVWQEIRQRQLQSHDRDSSPRWYYIRYGQEKTGPISFNELRRMVSTAQLSGHICVRNEDMQSWTTIANTEELGTGPPYPVAYRCPRCTDKKFKTIAPKKFIYFVKDKVCDACGTRYKPVISWYYSLAVILMGLMVTAFGGLLLYVKILMEIKRGGSSSSDGIISWYLCLGGGIALIVIAVRSFLQKKVG